MQEATAGGKALAEAGYKFDVAYTSLLTRAQVRLSDDDMMIRVLSGDPGHRAQGDWSGGPSGGEDLEAERETLRGPDRPQQGGDCCKARGGAGEEKPRTPLNISLLPL